MTNEGRSASVNSCSNTPDTEYISQQKTAGIALSGFYVILMIYYLLRYVLEKTMAAYYTTESVIYDICNVITKYEILGVIKFVFNALFLYFLVSRFRVTKRDMFINKCRPVDFAATIPMLVINICLSIAMGYIIPKCIETPIINTKFRPDENTVPWNPYMGFITMAIFPAIIEELFDRGVSLSKLLHCGRRTACIIISLFFAIGHCSVTLIVPYFIISMLFTHITLKTNSILPVIFAHFVYNAVWSILSINKYWMQCLSNFAREHKTLVCCVAFFAFLASIIAVVKYFKCNNKHDKNDCSNDKVTYPSTRTFFKYASVGIILIIARFVCLYMHNYFY